jgi:hypothetical protein
MADALCALANLHSHICHRIQIRNRLSKRASGEVLRILLAIDGCQWLNGHKCPHYEGQLSTRLGDACNKLMDGVIWGPTFHIRSCLAMNPMPQATVRCIWLSAANPLCILRESIPKENHSDLTVTTQYLAYNLFLLEFVRHFADALIMAKNWGNDDCTADVWRSVNNSVLTKYADFGNELLLALTTAALGQIPIKMEELVTSSRTKDPYDVLPVSSNSSGVAGSSKGPSEVASSSTSSRSCSWQAISDGLCTIYGSYGLVVRLPFPVITTVYNRLTEYGWMPTDSVINIALAESIWHLMGLSLPSTILEKDYPPAASGWYSFVRRDLCSPPIAGLLSVTGLMTTQIMTG